MNKIKHMLFGFVYSLSFGLKAINDLLLTQKISSNSDDSNITQKINQNSLKQDLLRGEVTQAVEELRYTTYEVSKESKKYNYIGDGQAIKKEILVKDLTSRSFFQENKLICEDVLHEIQNVDNYGEERYVVNFIYENTPKFKLEQFLEKIEVNVNNNISTIVLHFETIPNKYKILSKPFIAELGRIISSNNKRHEILTDINNISFITYKAHGEEDLIKYSFYNPTYLMMSQDTHEFTIKYECTNFTINDLTEKFESKSKKMKYNNKEKKVNTIDLSNSF